MSRLRRITPILLVLLYVWMAGSVSQHVGVTADEPVHLAAGLSYNTQGDYRFQPENGNLTQRWAALPLRFMGVSLTAGEDIRARADTWALSRHLLFESGQDARDLLAAGRWLMALWGGLLVWLVYAWSRSLFGGRGALVSLILAAFCPHLLAHGGLTTSDLGAALGFTAATLAWWRLCHHITPARLLGAGTALGFLALCKFSVALFAPLAVLLALVRLMRRADLPLHGLTSASRRLQGFARWPALIVAGLVTAVIATALVWAAFGFRYSATPDGGPSRFIQPWSEVLIEQPALAGSSMADGKPAPDPVFLKPGLVQSFVHWGRAHRILPEAYLYGLAFTDRHSRARLAYFAGDYRETGWRWFFPAAFALKTTLPALGLLLLAVLIFPLRASFVRRRLLYRTAPLTLLVAIYAAFAISSHLNIGHRHLLVLYPALYILAGSIVAPGLPRIDRRWAPLVLVVLVWHVAESWSVRPHYLTYFNQAANGPDGGHRYLVDSSLDWGQSLPDLKDWLDRNPPAGPLYLSYFGSDDPRRLGIHATRIGDVYFDFAPRVLRPPLTAGTYCIGATMLHRVYTRVRGPWTADYENAYRRLQAWTSQLPSPAANTPPLDEAGRPLDSAAVQSRLLDFDQLRFGRLCLFLQNRPPDAIIAHSLFVYRLTDAEVFFALNAPVEALKLPTKGEAGLPASAPLR